MKKKHYRIRVLRKYSVMEDFVVAGEDQKDAEDNAVQQSDDTDYTGRLELDDVDVVDVVRISDKPDVEAEDEDE